jgi:hypothetical protein
MYLHHLHYYVTAYSAVIVANFTTVFCCMAVIYLKAFCRIRRMILTKKNNENTPLNGATQAMILAAHKDAKKRVLIFFSVYFISGAMSIVGPISRVYECPCLWLDSRKLSECYVSTTTQHRR